MILKLLPSPAPTSKSGQLLGGPGDGNGDGVGTDIVSSLFGGVLLAVCNSRETHTHKKSII